MPLRHTSGEYQVGSLAILSGGAAAGDAGAATLNGAKGTVTTEDLTTAAGATFTETIANSWVEAGDVVLASVNTAGAGMPAVTKVAVTAGQIVIVIQNVHASAAFDEPLVISFVVIK